jgi:hypothetical protein
MWLPTQLRRMCVFAANCRTFACFVAALALTRAASAGPQPYDSSSRHPGPAAPPGAEPEPPVAALPDEAPAPSKVTVISMSDAASASRMVPTGVAENMYLTGGSSARSYAEDWLVNPNKELEVGGTLRLVTAPQGPFGGRSLRFTDVGLFGAHARYATGGRFEFDGGVSLLAKQPTNAREPIVQGGNLGVRFRLFEKWALWARGAGGPMLADLGAWGEGAAGAQVRTSIDEYVRFQGSLGGAVTRLAVDGGKDPWFAEVSSHGEVLLTWSKNSGVWLGADYRVPVAHRDGALELDPKVRLSIESGIILGFVKNWDLYGVATVIDRGDLNEPTTTIPVLDGGFDQMQFLAGVAHHFDLKGRADELRAGARRAF